MPELNYISATVFSDSSIIRRISNYWWLPYTIGIVSYFCCCSIRVCVLGARHKCGNTYAGIHCLIRERRDIIGAACSFVSVYNWGSVLWFPLLLSSTPSWYIINVLWRLFCKWLNRLGVVASHTQDSSAFYRMLGLNVQIVRIRIRRWSLLEQNH